MWKCPKCNRNFKSANQWHSCSTKEIGELFIDCSDEQVLIFDKVLQFAEGLPFNSVGAAKHSVVFTSQKAWLIFKPMKTEVDLKFYCKEVIPSSRIKKVTNYSNKFAHHIRIKAEEEVDTEILELLKMGYDYSLQ